MLNPEKGLPVLSADFFENFFFSFESFCLLLNKIIDFIWILTFFSTNVFFCSILKFYLGSHFAFICYFLLASSQPDNSLVIL